MAVYKGISWYAVTLLRQGCVEIRRVARRIHGSLLTQFMRARSRLNVVARLLKRREKRLAVMRRAVKKLRDERTRNGQCARCGTHKISKKPTGVGRNAGVPPTRCKACAERYNARKAARLKGSPVLRHKAWMSDSEKLADEMRVTIGGKLLCCYKAKHGSYGPGQRKLLAEALKG